MLQFKFMSSPEAPKQSSVSAEGYTALSHFVTSFHKTEKSLFYLLFRLN